MQQAGAAAPTWPRPAIAWYAVAILVVAFIFSFIDRTIIALLVQPLKNDLGLTDGDIGLLSGPAFALFYTLVGIPIGRWADRYSRRLIISVGIFLWSIMTAVCGLARNFWELFAARVGVGVGEATLSPAAYSMIADLFPREQLGRAVGVYQAGAFFGIGLAFMVGGLVIRAVSTSGGFELPVLGAVRPWQLAFMAVGIPGVLVALLMWTVREPVRRGLTRAGGAVPFGEVVQFVWQRRRIYLLHYIGFALLAMPITTIAIWSPVYFGRVLGYTPPEAGLTLGTILILLSPLGVYSGGWIADLLQRRGQPDATLRVGVVAACLLMPLSAATLAESPTLALALFCPLVFAASLSMALAPAALQVVTPNEMRAQISAVWMLFLNIVTSVLAGWVVGLITEHWFQDELAVGRSIALVNMLSMPAALLALWFARAPFREAAADPGAA